MGEVSSEITKRGLYLNLAEAKPLLETFAWAVPSTPTAFMLILHKFQIYRESMNQLPHNS